MATFPPLQRRPLGSRSLQNTTNPSPSKHPRVVSGSKRARSPDHTESQMATLQKRVRPTVEAGPPPVPVPKARDQVKDKQKRLTERAQKEAEFRRKYRKDFPTWTFYIDSENLGHKLEHQFKGKILRLGGKVDDFFSSSASHLVTNRPIPKPNTDGSKENKENAKTALQSPIRLIGRGAEDPACSIVNKASEYGMKIWTAEKLESVLSRCLAHDTEPTAAAPRSAGPSAGPQRALSRLLQNEKIHGSTERDPTQKRRDWHYFSRGSCFVLVEDMNKELATIAAHEYPPVKDKEAIRKPWPVLHCHPLARNPFAPFDDKERRRYEKQQAEQKKEEADNARLKKEKEIALFKRKAQATQTLKAAGKSNAGGTNLRKTLSVSNLRRRLSHPVTHDEHDGLCIDLDVEDNDMESANASGYNQSGASMNYIAASGNSVGITSTTGTTSTSGRFQRTLSTLPDRFGRHIITSFKVSGKEKVESEATTSQMGPPSKVPDRAPLLRKSKSTNTLKLPKREEGAKPGYCESCRVKFDDFATHTISNRHRKFASNPANFAALDRVLERLQRRNRAQIAENDEQRTRILPLSCPLWQTRNGHLKRNIDLSSPGFT